eukprot:3039-Heterococcus_DN1.PRE.1
MRPLLRQVLSRHRAQRPPTHATPHQPPLPGQRPRQRPHVSSVDSIVQRGQHCRVRALVVLVQSNDQQGPEHLYEVVAGADSHGLDHSASADRWVVLLAH